MVQTAAVPDARRGHGRRSGAAGASLRRVRRVLSVGLGPRRRRGLHGVVDERQGPVVDLDDPQLSPDVAPVLRLPHRCPLRVGQGVPRPLRSGPDPGLPRVEHGRPSERVRGAAAAASADLRRGPDALRLPRRPGGVDRSGGQEGLARCVARRHDVEEHLRVRAAPQRAVPPRRGRPAPQSPRPRLGPLRIGPRALRQGAARRPAAAGAPW